MFSLSLSQAEQDKNVLYCEHKKKNKILLAVDIFFLIFSLHYFKHKMNIYFDCIICELETVNKIDTKLHIRQAVFD